VLAAIREDRTPNLLLMRYTLATWEVRDLLLIPSFMFSESAVIKRPPLAATARRVHPPQDLLRRTGRLGGLQHCLEPGACRSPDFSGADGCVFSP
jgi:Dam-replacing family